jgi:hypothetical protein
MSCTPSAILYSTYVGHAAAGAAFPALKDEWMDDDETLDEHHRAPMSESQF